MVRRLCILCFLVALWPGLALAQSAALMEASKQYKALYEKGRYGEAERFARKALELSQREFGPDHPTTATFLNNLAALHQVQGRYAEAEPLHKRALAIVEKALGPEHPNVATSLENYAVLLRATGRTAGGGAGGWVGNGGRAEHRPAGGRHERVHRRVCLIAGRPANLTASRSIDGACRHG